MSFKGKRVLIGISLLCLSAGLLWSDKLESQARIEDEADVILKKTIKKASK